MPVQSILAWLAIGLVVDIVGKLVVLGRDPGGAIATIVAGIVGAVIGGFVAQTMQWTPSGTWQNFVASLIGAVVILAGYRFVQRFR